MTKKLRILTNAAFTTKGSKLTWAELDQTLIDIQTQNDANTAATHTQNSDRYLRQGESREYDSFKNFVVSWDGTVGDDSGNTVTFNALSVAPFTAITDYEIDVYGLIVDEDNITQRVEVGYKTKTINSFIAMPTVDCHIVATIKSNLRARTGI